MSDVLRALNAYGHYVHLRMRAAAPTGRTRATTNVTKPTTSLQLIDELFIVSSRYIINYVNAINIRWSIFVDLEF